MSNSKVLACGLTGQGGVTGKKTHAKKKKKKTDLVGMGKRSNPTWALIPKTLRSLGDRNQKE